MSTVDIDSKELVESLMEDGTFDLIRKQVVEQLKNSDEMKQSTRSLLAKSALLAKTDLSKLDEGAPGAPQKKKQLQDQLHKELHLKLLEAASQAAWKLLTDAKSPVSSQIETEIHKVLCQKVAPTMPVNNITSAPESQPQAAQKQSAAQPSTSAHAPASGQPTGTSSVQAPNQLPSQLPPQRLPQVQHAHLASRSQSGPPQEQRQSGWGPGGLQGSQRSHNF